MTIYNAYLIKGYLIDKKAPKRIMEALDTLIGGLHASDGTPKQQAVVTPSAEEEEPGEDDPGTPPDTVSLPAKPPWAAPREPDGGEADGRVETADASVSLPRPHDGSPAADPVVDKPRKPREWSPEARAAASERLRARQAAGLMGKRKLAAEPAGDEPPSGPSKPYAPASVDKLLIDHNAYAGKRDSGQPLTDEDWPDIKARLAKNPDRRTIVSDYDVELDELNFFIQSCQRREGKSPGEALASPSGVASGATRKTW